jgi:TRAP-type C4-dicarboxylate transport system permease small subunit
MAFLLFIGPLSAVVVVAVLAMSLFRRATQHDPDAEVPRTLTRTTAAWRWGGVVAGGAVAVLAAKSGALGRGLLLAAPLFGLGVLVGVLVGEFSVRAPGGRTRQAAVEVRAVRDYLPRRLSRAVITAGCGLFLLLLGTTAAGSPDDLNRAGRSLFRRCDLTRSESHGPWAGSFYSIPLALVVLVGVVTAVLALRQTVRRPRPEDALGQIVSDDVPRRRTANAVTGACGVLVSIPLIGVCLVTAEGLLSISCAPMWWTVTGWLLLASIPVWLVLLGSSALAIFSPTLHAPTVRAVP